jgi:hypothetical protein
MNRLRKWYLCTVDGTGEHHIKGSKPGSERQRCHVFSLMWKVDPIQIQTLYVHIKLYRSFFQMWD